MKFHTTLSTLLFVILFSFAGGCKQSSTQKSETPTTDDNAATETSDSTESSDDEDTTDTTDTDGSFDLSSVTIEQVSTETSFTTEEAISIKFQLSGIDDHDVYVKLNDAPEGTYIYRDDDDDSVVYFVAPAQESGTLSFNFIIRDLETCADSLGSSSECESSDSFATLSSAYDVTSSYFSYSIDDDGDDTADDSTSSVGTILAQVLAVLTGTATSSDLSTLISSIFDS